MSDPENSRTIRAIAKFPAFCSALVVGFGLLTLSGWAFHIQPFKSFVPGQVAVKANTGACFVLIGIALWLVRRPTVSQGAGRRLMASVLALVVSVVGLLSAFEVWKGWDFGIDQLIFRAGPEDLPGSVRPGLMSPVTGIGFWLLGIAITLLNSPRRWVHYLLQLVAGVVAVVSVFGTLDYVLDPRRTHTYVAPTTALALFLFSFAVILSRTEWGFGALATSVASGGELVRRLLPAAILIPIAIGWLRWKGELAGLFTDWAGVALMVVMTGMLLAAIIIWTAFVIDRTDAQRRQAEESVRLQAAQHATLISTTSDGYWVFDRQGKLLDVNEAYCEMSGYSRDELLNMHVADMEAVEESEEVLRHIQRLMETGFVRFESKHRKKDGEVFDVEISASALSATGQFLLFARDITPRRLSEEKLRTASLYNRSLLEASLDPLVTISKDGKITDVNQATETATGITRDHLMGTDFSNYFSQPERARQGYRQVFAEGFVRDYPLALRHASGKVMDVLYNASLFRNANGEVDGIFAAARDVTERKRAEEDLRRASLYTRSLIEASPDPLVTIDKDGRITDVNEATERATGFPRKRLIGSDFSNYFTVPEKADQGYRRVFAEGFVRDYPLAIRHTSGSVIDVLYNASLFKNEKGGIEGVFAAARDVTERKRAEEQLRRASLYARSLIEASLDPLVTIRKDGKISDVNQATEQVTGVSRKRLIGSNFADYFTEPDKAQIGYERVFSQGSVRDYPLAIRNVSGAITDVLYNATLFTNDAGEVEGVFAAARDVTRMKVAEREIHRLNEELEQRVIQRTAQLEAANKELEAFTYSVSHDLRAPLRHISGFSKILTEEFAPLLPAEAQHHLARIEEGTRRMGLLVDDLLNLARVGRRDISLQVTGLKSVVEEVINNLKPDVGDRLVEWKIGNLPYIECDTALIKQVFQNLLSNALKFTRPRPLTIIEVGQAEKDGSSVIYVRDNGVGFSMKYVDKLFGVFQRLHRSEDFEGTGVGLATVQRIIQKHGGRIWAEAELDRGATFYFSIGNMEQNEVQARAAMAGAKS